MKKEKTIPLEEPKEYDKFGTFSATECTGLITVPPQSDAELESYKDICEYEVELDKIK